MENSMMKRRAEMFPLTIGETIPKMLPIFAPAIAACVGFLGELPKASLVKASTTLIKQDSLVKKVQLLQSGLVKLTHLNADGHENLIGLRSDGWYAGSTSAVLGLPSVYSVHACTDCAVVEIPLGDFLRCLRSSQEMMDHFIQGLCREVVSSSALQVQLTMSKAEDRLDLLLQERSSDQIAGKSLDPLRVLKQTELAQLISITPEHLSRLRKKRRMRLRAGMPQEAVTAWTGATKMTPRPEPLPPYSRVVPSPMVDGRRSALGTSPS
jgi:CRP-like cAMP-binding protein